MLGVQPWRFQIFTSSISYNLLRLKISLLNTIEVAGRWLLMMTVHLKNKIRNTARKDLKPSWLNAQHSEVFFGGLLCSFSPSRPCTKLPQSYEEFAFSSKNDRKQAIFAEKSKFFVTLRQLSAGSRRAKRTLQTPQRNFRMLCVQPWRFQIFTSSISYIFLRLRISLLNTIEVAGRWLLMMTVWIY